MTSQIVILGCGIGGLALSNSLVSKVNDQASITVIERKGKFDFAPSFAWLMVGTRNADEVQRGLDVLGKKGVNLAQDEVTEISLDNHQVRTRTRSFEFDYLVVALGADYDDRAIPGFERAHHIYDLESAVRLRDELEKFDGGKVVVGVARTPFKCPAAPYEAALLIDHLLRRRKLRDKSSITFFTPEGQPLPAAGPEIGGKVLTLFKERGIEWNPKEKLTKIENRTCTFESGKILEFDLLFCVPPHRAPEPVVKAGLTDQTGWIPINPRTMETAHQNVYALGDITALPTPHGYVPYLPKAGVFAHGQAETLARNLASKIKGRKSSEEWNGKGSCFLETGYGKAAYVSGNFLAEPRPELQLRGPNRRWHLGKVFFEKYWLWKYL